MASKPDFAHVYDEHVWSVYGFFAYRLGSRADAEDLTQMTFERALRAWERYDERRGGMATWLLAIARNLLVDHYRRGEAGVNAAVDVEALGDARPAATGGPEHDDLGLSPELASALRALSARELEIIALRFGADLTGRQIADLMGLSLANVQQILSRSLRALRAKLGERDGTSGRTNR